MRQRSKSTKAWHYRRRLPVNLSAEVCSTPGTMHLVNEDHHLIDADRKLFIIADGIGGARGGSRASYMAVHHLASALRLPAAPITSRQATIAAIQAAFLDANEAIVRAGERSSELFGMGSTALLAVAVEDRLFVASLGDSRGYLLREDYLWQYTVDHTMAQALVSTGVISRQAARHHRWRHKLWKYLGCPDLQEGPEVSVIRLQSGDRFLMMTDGVSDVLDQHAIAGVASQCGSPAHTARELVRAAVTLGSCDDATCLALFADSRHYHN